MRKLEKMEKKWQFYLFLICFKKSQLEWYFISFLSWFTSLDNLVQNFAFDFGVEIDPFLRFRYDWVFSMRQIYLNFCNNIKKYLRFHNQYNAQEKLQFCQKTQQRLRNHKCLFHPIGNKLDFKQCSGRHLISYLSAILYNSISISFIFFSDHEVFFLLIN